MVNICIQSIFDILNCFMGYRLKKLWMALLGFLAGAFAAYYVGGIFISNKAVVLVISVVIGLVVASFAMILYLAGIFIIAAVLSAVTAHTVLPLSGTALTVVTVVIAAAIGILAVKFTRPVLIIVSSVSGGFSLAGHLAQLVSLENLFGVQEVTKNLIWIAGAILSLAGILIQMNTTKKEDLETEC